MTWKCAHCDAEYDDKEDACMCCVEADICYQCCYCGTVHDDEEDAEDCCEAGCASGYLCHCGKFYESVSDLESCDCHEPDGYDLCPVCGQPDYTGFCCGGIGRWTPDLKGQQHLFSTDDKTREAA